MARLITDPDVRAVIKHRNIAEVGYNIQTMVDSKHLMIVDVFAGGVTDRGDWVKLQREATICSVYKKLICLQIRGITMELILPFVKEKESGHLSPHLINIIKKKSPSEKWTLSMILKQTLTPVRMDRN